MLNGGKGKRAGSELEEKLGFNTYLDSNRRSRSVTSFASLIMSVRIFPPSDEKHNDSEFHLDKFMGKWSVAYPLNIFGFFPDFLVGMSPIQRCRSGR